MLHYFELMYDELMNEIPFLNFLQEYPWIISCSDDQTIRIWNWQSRNCIRYISIKTNYKFLKINFFSLETIIVFSCSFKMN